MKLHKNHIKKFILNVPESERVRRKEIYITQIETKTFSNIIKIIMYEH